MLLAGDVAPDFVATAQDGSEVRLSSFRGGPVVVYFYPKAGTMGCTQESMAFAQHFEEFRSKGVRIVGISVDDVDRQRKFAEDCHLPFPVLSDASREIARSYGALGAFGHAKRVTFIVDGTGRIDEVIDSFLPSPHIERTRRRWAAGGSAPR